MNNRNSRMDRYDTSNETKVRSRTSKNRNLYEEVSNIDVSYIDINDPSVIGIPKKEIVTKEEYKVEKTSSISLEDIPTSQQETEERIYDINEILRRAKQELKEEEKKRRLINTEYNILTKLDIESLEKIKNEEELKEEQMKELIEIAYPKKERIDHNRDLFDDLKDDEIKEEVEEIINTRIENVIVPASEEKLKEDTKEVTQYTKDTEIIALERKSRTMLVFIILIVLALLGTGAYFILKYFEIL